MTKKLLPLALTAALALGALSSASAHTRGATDGNDTASALDLASAKLSHTRRAYKGTVATHDAFSNAVLGAAGDLYFDLDLTRNKRFDHYVWINNTSRGLIGKVFKKGRARALGRASVTRVDAKTLRFSFGRKVVRRTKRTVGFGARSRWTQPPTEYGGSTLLTDRTPRGSHRF